jgi:hypothetical protein
VTDVATVADAYAGPDELGGLQFGVEHMEWLAYCAEAFGFNVRVSKIQGAKPSLVTNIAAAQHERWARVDQTCTEEAIDRGWFQPFPRSAAEREAEYERLSQVNQCLAGLGYGTTPPSKEAFVENMDWNVYANTPRGAPVSVHPDADASIPRDSVPA